MLILRNVTQLGKVRCLRCFSACLSTAVTYKEEKINVGKYNINYLKTGNGPQNVLCMPGALGTIWTDFKPQVEGFNKEKFTTVFWDPPGYGKSRPPEREFSTDFYERDADVAYEFMKALNTPKFSILGWSDGAISGMILAGKYRDAVEKLVICAAHSFLLPDEVELYKKIRDVKKWSEKMREPMINAYGEEKFAKLWADWVDVNDDYLKEKAGMLSANFLKNIKCPTFILYGQKDPICDKRHIPFLNTNIAGSRVHFYPDGKHNIHLKYPEDFNKRVQEFLLEP